MKSVKATKPKLSTVEDVDENSERTEMEDDAINDTKEIWVMYDKISWMSNIGTMNTRIWPSTSKSFALETL